jgi:phosphohistidine phosphatase
VGHNPGLTEFANRLLDDAIDNIPTCGIIAGELNIESWYDLAWGCGEREFFETPR